MPMHVSSDAIDPAPGSHGSIFGPADVDGAPPAACDAATWTVLSIEDNASNQRLIQKMLAVRDDLVLVPAESGRMGLVLAAQHRPDLVLLDLHLPDIDGDEVIERLRANPVTAEIPVIVMSADATPARIERALAGGAQAYITKPLDVDTFRRAVRRVVPPR